MAVVPYSVSRATLVAVMIIDAILVLKQHKRELNSVITPLCIIEKLENDVTNLLAAEMKNSGD